MIIGISGKIGSGKSTVGQFLVNSLDFAAEINFADALKDHVALLFAAPPAAVRGTQAEKLQLLPCGLSARVVMQAYGQAVRSLDRDAWVRAWERSVRDVWARNGMVPIVVTDVRYRNEARAIREKGGILIRLLRAPQAEDRHASETDLDGWQDWDLSLDNRDQTPDQTCSIVLVRVRELGVL